MYKMSFAKELNTLIKTNTSVYATVGGNIFFENIPDNFNLANPFLVYSFTKAEPVRLLSGVKVMDVYNLTLRVVHKDTANLETTTNILVDYLDNKSSGKFQDITFENDQRYIDLEKGLYQNELNFKIQYV
jgi:hypothetical protein